MANAKPISFLAMKYAGQINGLTDTFKLILMESGFVYDPVTMQTYADISASELPTGNGYTAGGVTLTGVSITENTTDVRAELAWADTQIIAAGGTLVASGGIIFDDTPSTGSGDMYTDPIVSYKDAGGDVSAINGTPITFTDIIESDEDISS